MSTTSDLTLNSLAPLLLALLIAYFVRRWFIPQQLKNLQVAFEIDEDLYEVHRITGRSVIHGGCCGPGVGYGVLLYMMGLTGVLILIAELLFDAEVFAQFNLYIIAGLILIPVVISPWESLNSQLSSRQRDSLVAGNRIGAPPFSLAFLVIVTLLVLAYGIQLEGALSPTWLAFCNAHVHGANNFCLRANHGCLLEHAPSTNGEQHGGERTPLTPTKTDSLAGCSRFCS